MPGTETVAEESREELAGLRQQLGALTSELQQARHDEEQRRRALRREEALGMKRAEDWERVVVCFWMELKKLVEFGQCSIDLVDLQRERFFLYQVGEGEVVQKDWFHVLPLSLKQAMETGEPVYRRNRKEMERCGDTIETLVNCCSVVDVPFLGGTFAINSAREDAFSPRDIQVWVSKTTVRGFRRP